MAGGVGMVPPRYQRLYQTLEQAVTEFGRSVEKHGEAGKAPAMVYAANLRTGDCHRGEALLTPEGWQSNMLFLDRLQSMGVQGVKVPISYPCLVPDFPRYTDYLAFYKRLFSELRRRHMASMVQVGSRFNTADVQVKYDYATGMTFQKYKDGKKQQIGIIIRELQPDYVTVAQEPTTEASNAHVPEVNTVKGFSELVGYLVQGLNKGKTLTGAGTGNWSDPKMIGSIAHIPALDYVDLHIYPAGTNGDNYLEQAMEMARTAAKNGKRLTISEFWLYKAGPGELGGGVAATPRIFRRDAYGFWAPLDRQFIGDIVTFANRMRASFISISFGEYLFGYLPYSPRLEELPEQEFLRVLRTRVFNRLKEGDLSPSGEMYKQLIAEAGH
jgi:hypothetical protein